MILYIFPFHSSLVYLFILPIPCYPIAIPLPLARILLHLSENIPLSFYFNKAATSCFVFVLFLSHMNEHVDTFFCSI
jgi:hypothetical protein